MRIKISYTWEFSKTGGPKTNIVGTGLSGLLTRAPDFWKPSRRYVCVYMRAGCHAAACIYRAHSASQELHISQKWLPMGPQQPSYPYRSVLGSNDWVAVKEFKLSYHSPETILFTCYQYFGNLKYIP